MAYKDIAPIISGLGVTQKQVETYFENNIKEPVEKVEPEITKAKAVAIADALYVDGIEAHNGIKGLAVKLDLSTSQVKNIIKEIKVLESEWSKTQEVEE